MNAPRSKSPLVFAALLLLAAWFSAQHGGLVPLQPVESPFPKDGYWLLLASKPNSLDGVTLVGSAEVLRDEPELEYRWHAYGQHVSEPWQDALDWANEKSGGKPYYVIRRGDKAKEGQLNGNVDAMLSTVKDAMAEVRE